MEIGRLRICAEIRRKNPPKTVMFSIFSRMFANVARFRTIVARVFAKCCENVKNVRKRATFAQKRAKLAQKRATLTQNTQTYAKMCENMRKS